MHGIAGWLWTRSEYGDWCVRDAAHARRYELSHQAETTNSSIALSYYLITEMANFGVVVSSLTQSRKPATDIWSDGVVKSNMCFTVSPYIANPSHLIQRSRFFFHCCCCCCCSNAQHPWDGKHMPCT